MIFALGTILIVGWVIMCCIVLSCLGACKDDPKYYRKDGKL